MSTAPRRPSLVRSAAQAARASEAAETPELVDPPQPPTGPAPAGAGPSSPQGKAPSVRAAAAQDSQDSQDAGARAEDAPGRGGGRRLSSGRVSYAGRAVTIYFASAEDKDHAHAAFAARGGTEGFTSVSEWMADAILERTEAWETEHNDGKPFTELLARRQARRKRA